MEENVKQFVKDFNEKQKDKFITEYFKQQKKPIVYILLAMFLGGFGVHCFYLDNIKRGVLHLLFFWTFIPSFLALLDICYCKSNINIANVQLCKKLKDQIDYLTE